MSRALDFVVFLIFGSNSASSNLTQQYVKFKRKLFCGVSSCDDRCMLFVVGCAVHFFLREISTKICYLTDWLFWLNLPFVVVVIIGGWGDCADQVLVTVQWAVLPPCPAPAPLPLYFQAILCCITCACLCPKVYASVRSLLSPLLRESCSGDANMTVHYLF